jgi:hypothetical protein
MGAVVFNGRVDFKTLGRCGSSPGKLVAQMPLASLNSHPTKTRRLDSLAGISERTGLKRESMSTTPPSNSQSIYNVVVPPSRLTAAIKDAPLHLRPIFTAMRDAGVGFCLIPHGRQPFDPPTNIPIIMLIDDDVDETKGPQDFHQESLRSFVKRCTGATLVTCEPPLAAYAGAATVAALLRRDLIIVETRTEHVAAWKAALDAINPDLALVLCLVEPAGDVQ